MYLGKQLEDMKPFKFFKGNSKITASSWGNWFFVPLDHPDVLQIGGTIYRLNFFYDENFNRFLNTFRNSTIYIKTITFNGIQITQDTSQLEMILNEFNMYSTPVGIYAFIKFHI